MINYKAIIKSEKVYLDLGSFLDHIGSAVMLYSFARRYIGSIDNLSTIIHENKNNIIQIVTNEYFYDENMEEWKDVYNECLEDIKYSPMGDIAQIGAKSNLLSEDIVDFVYKIRQHDEIISDIECEAADILRQVRKLEEKIKDLNDIKDKFVKRKYKLIKNYQDDKNI